MAKNLKNSNSKVATRPEYVRIYDRVDRFDRFVADVTQQTCRIEIEIDTGCRVESLAMETTLTLTGFRSGHPRYFTLQQCNGTVINVKTQPEVVETTLYLSYHNMYPSEADYDMKRIAKPEEQNSILLKLAGEYKVLSTLSLVARENLMQN